MATEARFPIIIEGNAPEASREAADALQQLRAQIQGSETAIKEMNGTMRRLRGSSQEVAAAKADLKARIEAERAAISAATLEINKAGTSYDELASKAKKAAIAETDVGKATKGAVEPTKNAGSALKALGGPLAPLPERFENFKKALSGSGSSAGITALAVGGLILVLAALVAATTAATIALGKFILENANAARNASIAREAVTGSAEAAKELGRQVDELSRKVPIARAELNDLGVELARSGAKGDELSDTFAAVAKAASAMGKEAGDKVKAALEKSRKGQLLTPEDFEGTGLSVAGVKLEGGAKEIRKAVEKQFDGINARKMLDLNAQATRFKDVMSGMTRDVKLEPLLQGLSEVVDLFDESSVSGAAMKELVTAIGNGLSDAASGSLPYVKTLIKGLVIVALQAGVTFLQLRRQFRETFGDGDALNGANLMTFTITAAKVAGYALAGALFAGYVAIKTLIAPFVYFFNLVNAGYEQVKSINWSELGSNIVGGIVSGITGSGEALIKSVGGLAERAKDSFKTALGIQSPSKVFASFGENTVAGFAQGVDASSGDASQALSDMATPGPSIGPSLSGGAGASAPAAAPAAAAVFNQIIQAMGGAGGESGGSSAAAKLADPSIQAQLRKAVEDVLRSVGITPAPAGG